ncbi:hypothetical protein [Pseudomonas sp. B392_1p]|uniref:hypothetical protein n=1 Tax=Pseudomonas sp. B392_1p TaxID=3457507 RepID=UPI003FD44782
MKISEYDLKEILPRVQGPLKELLDVELSCGNSVAEISSGWPMREANVWLSKRFHRSYQEQYPNLKYSYLGDPKNWIEEYIDSELGLMVAVSALAAV